MVGKTDKKMHNNRVFTLIPKVVGAEPEERETKKRFSEETLFRAANGTRTRDLLITNELLYQLS